MAHVGGGGGGILAETLLLPGTAGDNGTRNLTPACTRVSGRMKPPLGGIPSVRLSRSVTVTTGLWLLACVCTVAGVEANVVVDGMMMVLYGVVVVVSGCTMVMTRLSHDIVVLN